MSRETKLIYWLITWKYTWFQLKKQMRWFCIHQLLVLFSCLHLTPKWQFCRLLNDWGYVRYEPRPVPVCPSIHPFTSPSIHPSKHQQRSSVTYIIWLKICCCIIPSLHWTHICIDPGLWLGVNYCLTLCIFVVFVQYFCGGVVDQWRSWLLVYRVHHDPATYSCSIWHQWLLSMV